MTQQRRWHMSTLILIALFLCLGCGDENDLDSPMASTMPAGAVSGNGVSDGDTLIWDDAQGLFVPGYIDSTSSGVTRLLEGDGQIRIYH